MIERSNYEIFQGDMKSVLLENKWYLMRFLRIEYFIWSPSSITNFALSFLMNSRNISDDAMKISEHDILNGPLTSKGPGKAWERRK